MYMYIQVLTIVKASSAIFPYKETTLTLVVTVEVCDGCNKYYYQEILYIE